MTFPQTLAITSPLKTGKVVADAQYVLAGHNVFKTKFYSGALDSQYGSLTAAAAHRAKFWLGYPKPDNAFGPILFAYLVGKTKLPLRYQALRKLRLAKAKAAAAKQTKGQKAIAFAKTFAGYRETPVNRTIFGKWYGLDGNAWCSMFASYCANHVGGRFRYSYVPAVVTDARQGRNGLFTTASPREGDLVCFDWNNDGTPDHIGFFDKWEDQAGGKFLTLEGNTLPEGGQGDQSNGGGVYARHRGTKDGYHVTFVRWS